MATPTIILEIVIALKEMESPEALMVSAFSKIIHSLSLCNLKEKSP